MEEKRKVCWLWIGAIRDKTKVKGQYPEFRDCVWALLNSQGGKWGGGALVTPQNKFLFTQKKAFTEELRS